MLNEEDSTEGFRLGALGVAVRFTSIQLQKALGPYRPPSRGDPLPHLGHLPAPSNVMSFRLTQDGSSGFETPAQSMRHPNAT